MKLIIDIDDEQVLFDIKNRGFEAKTETDKVIINALYIGTSLEEELEQIIEEVEDLFPDKGFEGYFQCQFDVIQILEKRISELKGE